MYKKNKNQQKKTKILDSLLAALNALKIYNLLINKQICGTDFCRDSAVQAGMMVPPCSKSR